MAALPRIPSPSGAGRAAVAGLAQVLLLLLALWAVLPGSQGHDLLRAAALLGLSLLPIGWGLRLPWLSFVALAWGAVGLLLAWQRQRLGIGPDGVGSPTVLPLLLAALAAATGQGLNLGLLPLRRLGQGLRGLARLAIAASVLLLLTYFGGGAGLGVALALLGAALAGLALTALTLILGAVESRRGSSGAG